MTPKDQAEAVENILMTLPTSDGGNYYHADLVQAFTAALQARERAGKQAVWHEIIERFEIGEAGSCFSNGFWLKWIRTKAQEVGP